MPFNTGIMDYGNDNTFRDQAENTMVGVAKRSARQSINRLELRYLRTFDFNQALVELCQYLSTRGTMDRFDPFRVAERALHPRLGKIGVNDHNLLKAAIYYWVATNDLSSDILASPDDRKKAFVRALYEIQRGGNFNNVDAALNTIDGRAHTDIPICADGSFNKLAESFVGLHPNVNLIVDINPRIFDLLRGLILLNYNDLAADSRPASIPEYTDDLTTADKNSLTSRIRNVLNGNTGILLFGIAEERYLYETLENLEYIEFPNDDTAKQLLIDDFIASNKRTIEERAMSSEGHRRAVALPVTLRGGVNFNYNLLYGTLQQRYGHMSEDFSVLGQSVVQSFGGMDFLQGVRLFNAASRQNDLYVQQRLAEASTRRKSANLRY